MDMIRSFIAVEIPELTCSDITQMISAFSQTDSSVKWVKHDNLHITLLFLGDATNEFIEKGKQELSAIATEQKSFEMSLSNIGAFPNQQHPRIIWIGVERGAVEMTELQSKIETQFTSIGYKPEDRKFHPHLTIGRVKMKFGNPKIFETKYKSPTFPVKSIVLFKSTLMPQGPIYEKLQEFAFD